jgi:hypothetical protein
MRCRLEGFRFLGMTACGRACVKTYSKIRRWEKTTHKLNRNESKWGAYVIELKLTDMARENSSPVSRISAFSHSLGR